METETINISKTLYQGLNCAKKAFDEKFTMDYLVNQAIEDFLVARVNFYKTQIACLENLINVYELEKHDGEL